MMNLFIDEGTSQSIGTSNGNSADPAVTPETPISCLDACARLAATGLAFGAGAHLLHRSQVWLDKELRKTNTRFNGASPEAKLGEAKRATEFFQDTEKRRKADDAEEKKQTKAEEKKSAAEEKKQKAEEKKTTEAAKK